MNIFETIIAVAVAGYSIFMVLLFVEYYTDKQEKSLGRDLESHRNHKHERILRYEKRIGYEKRKAEKGILENKPGKTEPETKWGNWKEEELE